MRGAGSGATVPWGAGCSLLPPENSGTQAVPPRARRGAVYTPAWGPGHVLSPPGWDCSQPTLPEAGEGSTAGERGWVGHDGILNVGGDTLSREKDPRVQRPFCVWRCV